jgi:antirestriction protein ArdC
MSPPAQWSRVPPVEYEWRDRWFDEATKDDKRAIFSAASHAQRAADFLHGLQKPSLQEVAQADAA